MAKRDSNFPLGANAFCCDVKGCGWQWTKGLPTGIDELNECRKAARKHVDKTGHEVHIETTMLEVYSPGRDFKNADLNESDAQFIVDSMMGRLARRQQRRP